MCDMTAPENYLTSKRITDVKMTKHHEGDHVYFRKAMHRTLRYSVGENIPSRFLLVDDLQGSGTGGKEYDMPTYLPTWVSTS